MRLIFFPERWKFHVDTKNAKKISQKVHGFLDKLIWIGNAKFSVTTRILIVSTQRVNKQS